MTVKSKLTNLEKRWDNMDKWLKRIVSLITGAGVVIGLFMGLFSWGMGKLDGFVDAKIEQVTVQVEAMKSSLTEQVDNLRNESQAADNESRLSRTRLELNTLISHNPDNIIEIEKVARYYFVDLGGDWYMSQIYSDWAREYGGDLTFVTHIK